MRTYERSWWWVKKKKLMALVFIIVTMILPFQTKGCVETERVGLLQLKSYFNSMLSPEESVLSSWSDDDPKSDCCHWESLSCSDAIGGHIVDLALNNLIPFADLGWPFNLSLLHSFPKLKTLDLSRNGFTHLFDPIHGHKSFQRLENLETLNLSGNNFNNSVLLFLSEARSLKTLNLGYNRLEGVFPPNGLVFPPSLQVLNLGVNQLSLTQEGYSQLCRLMDLRELDLSNNDLTSMPSCMGNLSHLRTLDLSKNQLNENLSAFVSSLPSALEYLSLLHNNFSGLFLFNSLVNQTRLTIFKVSSKVGMIQAQAESSWVPLFQLKMLMLHNFTLGSALPSFLLHQHDLKYVDLSYNKLTGGFPTWLVQNNTSLHTILLNSNSLTKLQLPRLVHGLQGFDISSNMIYDSIQKDIGIVFPKLRYMKFSSNQFHGTIPSSMGEMKSLKKLDLSSNSLSGQLPKKFLSSCHLLSFLKLSNNQFQGEIFPGHGNLTSLSKLLLDGNNFSGSVGKGLLNSKRLQILDVSDNRFSGMLPLWLDRMASLWYLNMRGNQLKGSFPHQLQSHSLMFLDISHNRLSGSIPKTLNFPSLIELRLQNNEFVGSIPDTLFKAEGLKVVDLRNNNFSGKICNTIGKWSSLRVLLLGNNNIQSHIPEEICQLSEIHLLDLSRNKFKGVIPSCLGNMSFGAERNTGLIGDAEAYDCQASQIWRYKSALILDNDLCVLENSLEETVVYFSTKNRYESYQGHDAVSYMYGMDLSSNEISGEIPVEIGNLHNIRSLNLSSNRLIGSIPGSMSKMNDLESLDLSNNELDGKIPSTLADLNSLGYFDVSCNNLSGEIPFKGHLTTFEARSYIGNAHLCGQPTNTSCNPTVILEPSATTQAKDEKDDVIDMVWFYWTCGAVYISTSLALFAFFCIDSRWSREWFYRVDLFIHHLQRYKHSSFCN